MRVEVTQQHIDQGHRAQASPIANALADAGFEHPKVRYGSFTAGGVAGNAALRRRYRLPSVRGSVATDREAVRVLDRAASRAHDPPPAGRGRAGIREAESGG